MSQHTPGPWKAWDTPAHEFDPLPTWTVSDPDGNDICTAEDMNGPAEAEANARLIAAAPELLATCEKLLWHFPDLDEILTDGDRPQRSKEIINMARAAIAKAIGKKATTP